MEHIVLEYDESTRTALVVATSGGREPVLSGHASPYIVADGYDFESRSWGAGHYFTDIAEAKIDYERSCRHPYPLAEGKLRDDEFCTIRWCREDIAEALSEYLAYPIPATEKNIDAAIGQLMAHDSFQDRSIEDGWETIGGIIVEDELDLGFSTKQGADFYRDAFGLSNFTEAVVWPSSEGDAAFVMTSAVDSEDGDLAVYKIDADLIGDSKITVDDIERLGGKRELCVYKHGFDGIEAIRAFANRVAVDRFDERFGVNNLYGELPDLAPTLRKVNFYRRIYDLLGDINGPCCGTAWASEDSSLVYFAVADEADGLTVFHIPSAALAQIDRRDQGDLHEFAGAIRDLHVDDAYAENSRVLEFARNSPAAASFGSGAEPEFGFYGVVYLYREDGKINFSAAVDSFAFKADTRDLAALRELSDAELASEIEKAGTAMTERVDAHMSHVHGLGGTEADSAAYYAARKWHADLQFESARRLHASTDRGQRESGRDPQAMANAAVKAASERDGGTVEHGGNKHQ